MKNFQRLLAICIMIVAAYSCGEKPIVPPGDDVPEAVPQLTFPAPENNHFRRVGYFPYYRDLSSAGIPDSTLLRLDVACFAFAEIQPDFTVKVPSPNELYNLVRRCKELGVKVFLSFNGEHSIYARMVSKKGYRSVFINI